MKTGFNTITIARYFNQENPCLADCGFSAKRKEEYIIDLLQSPTQLWRNLSKGQKWLINKGKKLGLTFSQSYDIGAFESLIACLCATKDRKAQKGVGNYNFIYIPYMNKEVLLKLIASKTATICLVKHQGVIICSCLLIKNSVYCYYLLAGSTPKGYELGGSSFMLWNVIEMAKADSCIQLNLGSLPDDRSAEKLAQFKHSFGSKSITCEGGGAYLQSSLRKILHRAYIVLSKPDVYIKYLLTALRNMSRYSQ